MLGVISLGQAGGMIGDIFAQYGVPTLAINYSERDLDTCEHIKHKLKLYGSEGVGKSKSESERLFANNYESTISFIKEHFSQPSIELILIIFSTGGGSGSGIAPFLTELLTNELPDKVFVSCPILPTSSEDITAQLNTLDTLSQLSDLNVCIIPLDNEKCHVRGSKSKLYKYVNEQFVNYILNLVEYPNKFTKHGNFDTRDLLTLLQTRGFCFINEVDISCIDGEGVSLSRDAITEKILNSYKNSIITSPSYEQIIRAAVIFNGQENLMDYVDPSLILSKFANTPVDLFNGYYHEDQGKVLTIMTGLKFSKNRLNQIEEIANKQTELFQATQQSTTITVNRPKLEINNKSKKKALSEILNKYKK